MPGALERPGASEIELLEDEDSTLEIRIPSRSSTFMIAVCSLLALNLVIFFFYGFVFFVLQKDVPGFSQISPTGLPKSLRIGLAGILFFWLLLESVGVALLYSIMRSAFTTETIRLGRSEITVSHRFFRERTESRYPIEEVNGFRLRRNPVSPSPSKLSIVVRGTPHQIAENAMETEREWINSIANLHIKNVYRNDNRG